jgi:hypothetical protein
MGVSPESERVDISVVFNLAGGFEVSGGVRWGESPSAQQQYSSSLQTGYLLSYSIIFLVTHLKLYDLLKIHFRRLIFLLNFKRFVWEFTIFF